MTNSRCEGIRSLVTYSRGETAEVTLEKTEGEKMNENGKWRYDSFGKLTENHRHGQYPFESEKEALTFAKGKGYTHFARWTTDESADSDAQAEADRWHTGSGTNYKILRKYKVDGDNCQKMVDSMADAIGTLTYIHRAGIRAPNITMKLTRGRADAFGILR
jgi:hypothetical protein